MSKKKKIVYIGLSGDIIHHGHINLIKKASRYGKLVVGLLTDKAILEKKKLPILSWIQRKKILKGQKILGDGGGINNNKDFSTMFYRRMTREKDGKKMFRYTKFRNT